MRRHIALLASVVLSASTLHAAAGAASIADAAMRGEKADVLALIKQGADVNAPQGDGVTALHWAARQGDVDLVSALVAAGANARSTTTFGAYTPLHLAAERGAASVVTAALRSTRAPAPARRH